ncbi:hypothetical protein CF394_09585 [Tetzosporium hominis]|uniref:Uncharacterized protein n=1 Tax=Tetzosporium hominis TaxID=2020506 RepID=A0A264W2E9_9BACL|nr:ankyrin repeat domain-containing protein [Tetzosporium hominis]OZS77776.1 hypothetical protein CF394_09585 [Tetzosporium hominis]
MGVKDADYWTIIMFRSLEDFKQKLKNDQKQIHHVTNLIDDRGISLLQQSLISRKFDIANLLLDEGSIINNISTEGYNELHCIAAHLDDVHAIQLTHRLIDLNVDLDLQDKKYGNSALFTICYEAFKVRTSESDELIISCLKKKPNVIMKNKYGYSVKQLIEENGTADMIKAMEAIS